MWTFQGRRMEFFLSKVDGQSIHANTFLKELVEKGENSCDLHQWLDRAEDEIFTTIVGKFMAWCISLDTGSGEASQNCTYNIFMGI